MASMECSPAWMQEKELNDNQGVDNKNRRRSVDRGSTNDSDTATAISRNSKKSVQSSRLWVDKGDFWETLELNDQESSGPNCLSSTWHEMKVRRYRKKKVGTDSDAETLTQADGDVKAETLRLTPTSHMPSYVTVSSSPASR